MIRGVAKAMLACAALVSLGGAAVADSRLVTHEYKPDEVVKISGKLGVQATIAFDEAESIENVAVGDSQSWQITPNKRANLLFVKPLSAGAKTNMTVVTDRHTYFFDLVASAKASPLYMLRFTYAKEPGEAGTAGPQALQQPALAALSASRREVLEDPDAVREENLAALNEPERDAISQESVVKPADPAILNFAWRRRGDSSLMPSRIYDDGKATYLSWTEDQSVPAILVRNDKGEEGPVNFAVRGSTIVIDDVPGIIVLRTGDESATLENMRQGSESARTTIPAFEAYRPVKAYFASIADMPFSAYIQRN